MRYFIRFSYDGSKFYGFQRQKNQVTVQKVIEDALTQICGEPTFIKGASRTDRGVHACGQCAHFDVNLDMPVLGLQSRLNKLVGDYIYIFECKIVSDDFHARFSVKQKRYRYRIYFGTYQPCFYDYAYFCPYSINVDVMKEASIYFLGVHDFRNFVSGERDSYLANISKIDFQWQGPFLELVFEGKSFYRYMVRNLVGALLDVGRGKRQKEEILESLSQNDFEKRFSTAISNGLYLEKIEYNVM